MEFKIFGYCINLFIKTTKGYLPKFYSYRRNKDLLFWMIFPNFRKPELKAIPSIFGESNDVYKGSDLIWE